MEKSSSDGFERFSTVDDGYDDPFTISRPLGAANEGSCVCVVESFRSDLRDGMDNGADRKGALEPRMGVENVL
jgi:hypothetical protein